MGVPGHHDAITPSRGIESQFRQVVQNVDRDFADLQTFRFANLLRPRSLVVVPADGGHGRNDSELLQYCRISNVTGMHDEVAAAQKCERFGPKQAVGVGNEADASHQAQSYAETFQRNVAASSQRSDVQ
jgi:hypothetical protein